jgi:hypothetical protein
MVQESRFRIGTESGRTLLFSMSSNASVDETDLIELHESNAEVFVQYEGVPNLDSGIAYFITEAGPLADKEHREEII